MTGLSALLDKLASPSDLLPAIVQDRNSKEVLMLAWMNRQALEETIATKRATFWSRSRKEIWVKGETSGNAQHLHELRFDCDADAILLIVDADGPACHTGHATCFFTSLTEISQG